MIKYSIVITMALLLVAQGCRTPFEKRVKKDIVGINEQLYDLEKNQIKHQNQVQGVITNISQFKKEQQEKEAQANNSSQLEKVYQDGYKKYLEQNYGQAIELLSRLTEKFVDNSLSDNALYWQAEAYFKLNRIDEALAYYQLVYRYFPFSNKADYALYKIGMIFFNKKDYSRASLAFNRLVKEYRNSDLYKATIIKINQLKKKKK